MKSYYCFCPSNLRLQLSEVVIHLSILRKALPPPPPSFRAYLLDVKEGKMVRPSYFQLVCIESPRADILLQIKLESTMPSYIHHSGLTHSTRLLTHFP